MYHCKSFPLQALLAKPDSHSCLFCSKSYSFLVDCCSRVIELSRPTLRNNREPWTILWQVLGTTDRKNEVDYKIWCNGSSLAVQAGSRKWFIHKCHSPAWLEMSSCTTIGWKVDWGLWHHLFTNSTRSHHDTRSWLNEQFLTLRLNHLRIIGILSLKVQHSSWGLEPRFRHSRSKKPVWSGYQFLGILKEPGGLAVMSDRKSWLFGQVKSSLVQKSGGPAFMVLANHKKSVKSRSSSNVLLETFFF